MNCLVLVVSQDACDMHFTGRDPALSGTSGSYAGSALWWQDPHSDRASPQSCVRARVCIALYFSQVFSATYSVSY